MRFTYDAMGRLQLRHEPGRQDLVCNYSPLGFLSGARTPDLRFIGFERDGDERRTANLGAATKTKPSFAWGLVGFVVAQPLLVVSGVDTAAAVSKQFGKTEVYMACRHCGHGWREDSLTTSNLKT